MDDGKGNFTKLTEEQIQEMKKNVKDADRYIFRVGEVLNIKGSYFKIKSVLAQGEIRLKLMKRL